MRATLTRARSELRAGAASSTADFAPVPVPSSSSSSSSTFADHAVVAGALDGLSLSSSSSSNGIAALRTLRDRFRAAVDAFGHNVADRSPVESALDVLLETYEAFRHYAAPHCTLFGLYARLSAGALDGAAPGRTPVETTFRRLLYPVVVREANAVHPSSSSFPAGGSGGKILLTGVRGVGKTTLLTAAEIAATLLCDHCLVVHLNYEARVGPAPLPVPPSVAVAEAARMRFSDWPAADSSRELDMEWVVDQLTARGGWLLLLVDELQDVYVEHFATQGRMIAQQLLFVGKHARHFAVASSSSAQMERLAFKHAQLCLQRPWLASFPDLNHHVFAPHRLAPIRDRGQFALLVRKNPRLQSVLAEHGVDALFARTGGVGRLLDRFVDGDWGDDDAWFKNYADEIAARHTFALIMSHLFFQETKSLAASSRPAALPSPRALRAVTFATIRRYGRDAGETESIEDLIASFVDRGLLCPASTDPNAYELLLPGALPFLVHRRHHPESPDFRSLTAFRAVFMDWEGHGSAGASCEPHVRRWLCRHREDLVPPFDERYVHVANPLVMRASKGAQAAPLLPWPAWEQCHGLFGVTNETGIDGLGLEPQVLPPDNIPRMALTLVQIKLGELSDDNTITAGRSFTSTNTSGDLRAMIGAACRGLNKLMTAWVGAPTIVSLRFILVTSKTLNAAAHDLVATGLGTAELQLPCSMSLDVVEGSDFKRLIPREWRSDLGLAALA